MTSSGRRIDSWFIELALEELGQDIRFFLDGAEGQVVKNQVHVCLQPADHDRDTEVDRLLALGATMLADHRTPDGAGWAVLQHPAGNGSCMTRAPLERHA